jgi:hypothetical protein
MGTRERSRELASAIMEPTIRRMAEHALGDCGNCSRRVVCSSKLIDVHRLFIKIAEPGYPATPGIVAKNAARFVQKGCAKCDVLRYCVSAWAEVAEVPIDTTDMVYLEVRALKDVSEDLAAARIQGWMDRSGIRPHLVLLAAGKMWIECEKEKKALAPLEHFTKKVEEGRKCG